MRRTPSLFLAAISLALLAVVVAAAATRPRYGGTLVIETGARITSLDPAHLPVDSAGRALAEKILFLIGDRLFQFKSNGRESLSLAADSRGDDDHPVWEFPLEDNVKFSEGQPLTAADVAHSLAALHPDWQITAPGGDLKIVLPRPMPNFRLELGLAENSILRRDDKGLPIGTGPFHITEFTPNEITLAATENGWQPRPFLDGIKILMGRAPRDQWIDFQLGRADLVELAPDQVRSAQAANAHLWFSNATDVISLVFRRSSIPAQDLRVRQALAAGVNRSALYDVLLQKVGSETRMLLPEWLSGFPDSPGPIKSSVVAPPPAPGSGPLPPLTLGFDSSDPLLASFAARIAVDARSAGLVVHLAPQSAGAPPAGDVFLVRQRIPSLDPARALEAMVANLDLTGVSTFPIVDFPAYLYDAERSLNYTGWVIPLVNLPEIYAVGPHVKNWDPAAVPLAGGWRLADVWKEPE
jgi:ABC-type transport system substrate-binding protein